MQALDIFLFFFLVCSLFWIAFVHFLMLITWSIGGRKSKDVFIKFISKYSLVIAFTMPLWAVYLPYLIAAYAPTWLKITTLVAMGIALFPTIPTAEGILGLVWEGIRDKYIRKKP